MKKFIFKTYGYDVADKTAFFEYGFEGELAFRESVTFEANDVYDNETLERALFLAFVLIGTSYYKSFPGSSMVIDQPLDEWQAKFFSRVYQEGFGQFAFENGLTRKDLGFFAASSYRPDMLSDYCGSGILVLQSGGKDSLLTATLLQEKDRDFTSWFVSSGAHYPAILNNVGSRFIKSLRTIDGTNIKKALEAGGLNGHVPITYIIQSLAVIQAVLLGKSDILTSIAHEGEEPHAHIDDLAVMHQWSKTWSAEADFAEYVSRYISPNIRIGSPLRCYSELKVAELFAQHAWEEYGHEFSSCNLANYLQGADNTRLKWDADCPKCANSYLLFAPFLPADELNSIFDNQDLFIKPSLAETFKGLLGVEEVMKPFECVGEVDELRLAYHMSQVKGGYEKLPFDVPKSSFDYVKLYPAQEWATEMLK